jgi:hypothetical protein
MTEHLTTESTVYAGKKGYEARIGVLELAKELGNVSKACKIMGYSRDSFYRFKRLYEVRGSDALQDYCRRRPLPKNRVPPQVEASVLQISGDHPTWGQGRVAEEVGRQGLEVSAAGVRCIWLRHGLQTTELRLQAVSAVSQRMSHEQTFAASDNQSAAE